MAAGRRMGGKWFCGKYSSGSFEISVLQLFCPGCSSLENGRRRGSRLTPAAYLAMFRGYARARSETLRMGKRRPTRGSQHQERGSRIDAGGGRQIRTAA